MSTPPIPSPILEYLYYGNDPSGEGLVGEDPNLRLASVHDVSVSLRRPTEPRANSLDNLRVVVTGPRLTKADGRSQRRCLVAKVGVTQPMWLQRLVIDARSRLRAQ